MVLDGYAVKSPVVNARPQGLILLGHKEHPSRLGTMTDGFCLLLMKTGYTPTWPESRELTESRACLELGRFWEGGQCRRQVGEQISRRRR